MFPSRCQRRERCPSPASRVTARIAGHILEGVRTQNCSFLNILGIAVSGAAAHSQDPGRGLVSPLRGCQPALAFDPAVRTFRIYRRRRTRAIQKTCTTPVCRNWRGFRAFSSLIIALDQFCTWVQLCSPRLRATLERKPKYENVHTIERARAAGSQNETSRHSAARASIPHRGPAC